MLWKNIFHSIFTLSIMFFRKCASFFNTKIFYSPPLLRVLFYPVRMWRMTLKFTFCCFHSCAFVVSTIANLEDCCSNKLQLHSQQNMKMFSFLLFSLSSLCLWWCCLSAFLHSSSYFSSDSIFTSLASSFYWILKWKWTKRLLQINPCFSGWTVNTTNLPIRV